MKINHLVRDTILNGLSDLDKEKKQFDKEFSDISERIHRQKAEMEERSKNRRLIQNR